MKKVKSGVVGCGTISDIYLENANFFRSLDVVMCADILPERAEAKANTTHATATVERVRFTLASP